jgi:O-methyltransferase domain/Dimerisation domain
VTDESPALTRLLRGYRISQAIHVAAVLGIADLLADGPRSADDLADATGSDPDALYRLLRALAGVGVFAEEAGRRFGLTPLGSGLRSDAPGSLRHVAVELGQPYLWHAWGDLLHSVRTGENAFRHVHGTSIWEFRARHPDASDAFGAAMSAQTARMNRSLLASFDFGRFPTLVDVGGGRGTFLAALLASRPAMRGVLFDLPHVVERAGPVLAAAGAADRCELTAGDFFDGLPAGRAAYLLQRILHNWEDAEAVAILTSCRRAMPDQGRVLLVERALGVANDDPEPKLVDLHMLIGPGGRLRTIEEYRALCDAARLAVVGVTPTGAGLQVLEAKPG